MDLDIQPLDIQPMDSLDIQPLDIQPMEQELPQASYSNEGRGRQLKGADLIPGAIPQNKWTDYDTGQKSLGILEQIPMVASGIYGQISAPVSAAIKTATGMSKKSFKEQYEEDLHSKTYQPRTEAGQDYAVTKTGELVNRYLMPIAPLMHMPAIRVSEGVNAFKARAGAKQATREANFRDNLDTIAAENHTPLDVQPLRQADMFGPGEATQSVKPAEAGAGPVRPEVRGELANRRQQELPLTPETLPEYQVTREGVAVNPADNVALMARNKQMEAMQAALEQERMAAQPIQNMPPRPNEPLMVNRAGEVGTMDQVSRGQLAPESPEVLALAKSRQDAIIEQQRLAAESEKAQNMHQMEIDDTQHAGPGEIYGAQYGTHEGIGRVDENGMPIRADLSMEAQNLQNPLQRNLWGDELGPALDQTRSMTDALDTLQHGPFKGDARDAALAALGEPRATGFMNRQRGVASEDMAKAAGVTIQRTSKGLVALKDGKEVGRLESNMTPEQNKGLGHDKEYPASIDIVKVDDSVKGSGVGRALYQAWAEDHGGNIAPSGKTTQAAWNQWKRNFPEKVDDFVNMEAQRIRNGASESQVLSNITDKNIANQIVLKAYEAGRDPFKSQRGHIRVPSSQKGAADQINKMGIFKNNIGHLLADNRTPTELIEAVKGQPDIPAISDFSFTKGGDYMTARTKNPVVKYGVDAYQNASRNIAGQQKRLVHDIYAQASRDLPKKDFIEAVQALRKAEEIGKPFTDEQLARAGLSQGARDFVRLHEVTMKEVLPKLNEALQLAGFEPVKARDAHLASKLNGQFRQVMTKDGKVVGAIGDTTKAGLKKQLAEFSKLYPDTVASPVSFHGPGRQRGMGDFLDTLNFMAKHDPDVAEFSQRVNDMMGSDILNYRGAKTHTMDKKGVPGLPGNRPWESAYQNAKDTVDAQIAYFNKVIEMSELAKADEMVKPLLEGDIGMPNAQSYLKQYRDMHLGRNPTKIGKAVEDVFGGLAQYTGGRSTQIGRGLDVGRNLLNKKLLTLNPGFLYGNFLQPIKALPEMAAYLRAHGADGYLLEGSAADTAIAVASHAAGKPVAAHMKGAFEFARESGMDVTDLLEHPNNARKSVGSLLETGLQKPAEVIESSTRQMMFFTMVDILHKNGVTKQEGLYTAAAKLTDKAMGNYSMAESPIALQNLGPLSAGPRNLSTYKFNELNRMMEFLRLAKDKNKYAPLVTSIGMQTFFAGLMGTFAYSEADQVVRWATKLMGKPTSITEELIKRGNDKLIGPLTVNDLSYGVHNSVNMDMTRRVGMGSVVDLENPYNLVMPGVGAVGTAAMSAKELLVNPNVATAKRALVDILPGSSVLEPMLFSKELANGNTLGINKNTGKGTVERTPTEQTIRRFGFTSARESRERTLEHERGETNQYYADKQRTILERMAVDAQQRGSIDPKYVQQYKDAHGFEDKPGEFDKKLQAMALDHNTSALIRNTIKDAQGKNTGSIIRRFK